jgi:hypothetical protein
VVTQRNVEFEIKLLNQGAYVGEHLSFGLNGKVLRGNAIAANRTREIRPSGMRGGLAETLAKAERAVFLPDIISVVLLDM